MSEPSSRFAAFLAELRRRRVFRVAAVYACVAFIIFQIVDATFEPLRLPDWASTLVVVLLALGFPIAVGMAWAFDLTAEGLVRAKVKREPTAPKAPHHIVIGNKTLAVIALLAIIASAWSWWGQPSSDEEAMAEPLLGAKSIAVLPFVNFSEEEGDWFSDGITDDILTHLCKIGDLKVIGRTSVMQYKNTTKRLRDIGRELGVATILEGSVRRADNRVRITSQLVDAKTEEHLWAETYDRDLTDIFAIQSDVASQIAAALKATLTPEEKDYIEQKPTDNLEAYDYYLKGNASFYRIWLDGYKISLEAAIPMYEKAIDLDPDFALAYARLARAHLRMYSSFSRDRTPERHAKAKSALDRALALAPDHPEVNMAHGCYYYHGFRDYGPALEQAQLGLKGQPNNAEINDLIGIIKRRQGKWEEAAAAMKKAAELDPRHVDFVANTAETNLMMHNWAVAERYAERLILIAPELDRGYIDKAWVHLGSKGDIEKAREIYQEALKIVGPDILIEWRSRLEIYSRDYQKALAIVEADTKEWFLMKADIYRYLGRPEQAAAYYDSARIGIEKRVEKDPDDYKAHGDLGIAYAGLSRREEAIREGKLAVEILPLSRDAFGGARYGILDLAKIYTMLGEQDAAIDQLEVLLSIPSSITVPRLKLDPQWDPLREHPRFKALVEKYGER